VKILLGHRGFPVRHFAAGRCGPHKGRLHAGREPHGGNLASPLGAAGGVRRIDGGMDANRATRVYGATRSLSVGALTSPATDSPEDSFGKRTRVASSGVSAIFLRGVVRASGRRLATEAATMDWATPHSGRAEKAGRLWWPVAADGAYRYSPDTAAGRVSGVPASLLEQLGDFRFHPLPRARDAAMESYRHAADSAAHFSAHNARAPPADHDDSNPSGAVSAKEKPVRDGSRKRARFSRSRSVRLLPSPRGFQP
jgi:hypothetical protein